MLKNWGPLVDEYAKRFGDPDLDRFLMTEAQQRELAELLDRAITRGSPLTKAECDAYNTKYAPPPGAVR